MHVYVYIALCFQHIVFECVCVRVLAGTYLGLNQCFSNHGD